MTTARLGWRGLVTVTVLDRVGGLRAWDTFPNLITDGGRALLAGALAGGDARIRYVSLGRGTTPPRPGDTQLEDEAARYPVGSLEPLAAGELRSRVYLADTDSPDLAVRELGWWAGPDATSEAGSGVLLARVLYAHDKQPDESVYVERVDRLERA